jgi:hypothetical protein
MGRKRGQRQKRTPSHEWLTFQLELIHPDQVAYEEVRPVVALHHDIKSRAAEIGVSPRTLSRRVEHFIQHGIPGLVPTSIRRADDGRLLPQEIREHLLRLKAEYPAFTPREIASILTLWSGAWRGWATSGDCSSAGSISSACTAASSLSP